MPRQYFTPEDERKLDQLATRYPSRQPLILAALHLAQKRGKGVLTVEALEEVADVLDLPYPHVYGVATFYTMFRVAPSGSDLPAREPVTLRVCTNISCMLRGAYEVLEAFETQLGIKRGQQTADIRIVEEECIAACANAPAVLCGNQYLLDVEPAQVREIIAHVKTEYEKLLESEVA